MKPLATFLVTVILGSVVGVAAAYIQYAPANHVYGFSKPDALSREADSGVAPIGPASAGVNPTGRPRVEVLDENTFDFGVMSRNERRSHEFHIRNAGDAPLTVAFVDKSCQCTDVEISQTELAPNETSVITLTWQPSTFKLDFHQTARFRTNDPGRIELDLTVKGRVQQVVQTNPRNVQFGTVLSGQSAEKSLEIFFYREAGLAVDHVELNDDASSAYLTTRIEPLSEEEIKAEVGAIGGQRIVVSLTGGLPVGRLRQHLRVHLSDPELGAVEVPIDGDIVGNLQILGGGFNKDSGIWDLGRLSGDQPHVKKLFIIPHGAAADTPIEMKVVKIDPDNVLSAEIQPPTTNTSRYTLSLRVQPIDRLVNRLGSQQGDMAEIVIETTSPEAPIIHIPVAFVIESHIDAPNSEEE
ncbi:MAG: DUF1573 domain-containing protein [Planctomycetales bacterium]|nr:DUF1573 domain-containing protein [Planctomycetales bacterium]